MIITPNLKFEEMNLNIDYANKLLGMKFTVNEVKNLLIKMGIEVDIIDKETINVKIPPYRTDIIHPMDIVEEIAIAKGYENFVPEKLNVCTIGKKDKFYKFCDEIRMYMVGLNFFEIMSLNLTNKKTLFKKMNIISKENTVVETENALSTEHCVMRDNLLVSLLSFLEKNKTKEYPQKIFEIGECIVCNKNNNGNNNKELKNFDEITKISGIIASTKTNFSEMKSIIGGILKNFDVNFDVEESNMPFFIEGRGAKILVKNINNENIDIGFFGEINPYVIENFNLEVPLTAYEINLSKLYEIKTKLK